MELTKAKSSDSVAASDITNSFETPVNNELSDILRRHSDDFGDFLSIEPPLLLVASFIHST